MASPALPSCCDCGSSSLVSDDSDSESVPEPFDDEFVGMGDEREDAPCPSELPLIGLGRISSFLPVPFSRLLFLSLLLSLPLPLIVEDSLSGEFPFEELPASFG